MFWKSVVLSETCCLPTRHILGVVKLHIKKLCDNRADRKTWDRWTGVILRIWYGFFRATVLIFLLFIIDLPAMVVGLIGDCKEKALW